jgi:hypothetical protein
MTRLDRQICRFLVALLGVTGTLAAASDEPQRPAPFELMEKFVSMQNNRMKIVEFDDSRETACPQITSLFYALKNRITFITPNYVLNDNGVYSNESYENNAEDFFFENRHCRYFLTVKRYDIADGVETEATIGRPPSAELSNRTGRDPPDQKRSDSSSDNPVYVKDNRIVISLDRIDPGKVGYTQLGVRFQSRNDMDATGIVYFGPKSFTIYLVNVAENFMLESEKDRDMRAYQVNLRNAQSRISLSIKKEVAVDGLWTKVFGE